MFNVRRLAVAPTFRPPVQRSFIGLLILLALVAGCTQNPLNPLTAAPRTIEPARAADSPPASQNPAGTVRPLAGHPLAAVFDSGTRQLAVLCPGSEPSASDSVAVFGAAQVPPRVIDLRARATALTGDDHGTVYLAVRGGYLMVHLAAGDTEQVRVADAANTDFTAIARRADGKLVLGSADGAVYILASASSDTATVDNRNKIFARVDALVTQGNTTVVLDRGQTSVMTIGADSRVEQALRAGEGATTLAADPQGRILVADTRGGQLLVYGVDPLILRQAYPVREAPYGLAGSRDLAWISQTASNVVIGYDLSTGIPVEKVRYPTVQQPNTLTFDEASDTLYVVSGSGAGIQIIDHAVGTP
ncbi:YncE family protein [Mycobacterium sp.]|uniref:YncE family protein n=1 Tax=Mycobacterium sp. TaxID=1785 RepID=UPI003F9D9F50